MDNRNGLDSFIAAGLSISEVNLSNVRLAQLKKMPVSIPRSTGKGLLLV